MAGGRRFCIWIISPLVGGAGSRCIQSSSQPMLDLALVALHHSDFARALERIELLTLLPIKHIVNPSLQTASWPSLAA